MGWDTIAGLLIQYGLPTVLQIVQKWTAGTPPTAADIQALIDLESRSAKDEMIAVMKEKGLDPTTPANLALLALAK